MFNKNWIIEKSIPIVKSYRGNLTIRGLHYRLVAAGMTNDEKHYKKVVNAMFTARWDGLLNFDDFKDHERETIGKTKYEETNPVEQSETAKRQIKLWADSFSKNRWENQPFYIALMEDQVLNWKLPPAPSKKSDSRSRTWDGLGQVELDAVEPNKIIKLLQEAIDSIFEYHLYDELLEQQEEENLKFKKILKRDFKTLLD